MELEQTQEITDPVVEEVETVESVEPAETIAEKPVEQEVQPDYQKEIEALKQEIATKDQSLAFLYEQKVKELPESLQSLVPDGLPVTDRLEWIEKAKQVETSKPETEPIVSIGKPIPVSNANRPESTAPLSPTDKMAGHFREVFGW